MKGFGRTFGTSRLECETTGRLCAPAYWTDPAQLLKLKMYGADSLWVETDFTFASTVTVWSVSGASGAEGVKIAVFVVELYDVTPVRFPVPLLTAIAPTRLAGSTSWLKVTVMARPRGTSVALFAGCVEATAKVVDDVVVNGTIVPFAVPVELEAAARW
jgi:hypothetical protein